MWFDGLLWKAFSCSRLDPQHLHQTGERVQRGLKRLKWQSSLYFLVELSDSGRYCTHIVHRISLCLCHLYRLRSTPTQCCGSGSVGYVCFWASRIRIRHYFVRILINKQKKEGKKLDLYLLFCNIFFYFLPLKTDVRVNVPSPRNKRKLWEKNLFFIGRLSATNLKSRICGSGSVSKFHGSTTLHLPQHLLAFQNFVSWHKHRARKWQFGVLSLTSSPCLIITFRNGRRDFKQILELFLYFFCFFSHVGECESEDSQLSKALCKR